MTSSGSDTNFVKVSDVITLSMKANDKLKAAPLVTVFTNAATVSGSNADSLWTATYTLPAALADGEVPFTLDFTDMAGNTGTRLTSTVNDPGLDVVYDEVPPDLILLISIPTIQIMIHWQKLETRSLCVSNRQSQ